jgi:hypothetical protein
MNIKLLVEKTVVQPVLSTPVILKSNCWHSAKKRFFSRIRINVFDVPQRRSRVTYGLRDMAETPVRIPLRAWMFVSYVCCVSSRFCNELITCSGEFVWGCVLIECDLETWTTSWPRPKLDHWPTEKVRKDFPQILYKFKSKVYNKIFLI